MTGRCINAANRIAGGVDGVIDTRRPCSAARPRADSPARARRADASAHLQQRQGLEKMAAASSIATRRTRAVESFKTAAECIGELHSGISLFAVTRGQFSMIDAILACLSQTGPASISMWTWTVAEYEIECLEKLRQDKRITDGRLIIDYGARNKNAGLIHQWKGTFGDDSVRYVVNHAKIARIESATFKLLLRGSMNLNNNPRFEQFDLTEGGMDFDLVEKIENDLPTLPDNSSGAQCYGASKVANAFDVGQLSMFKGVKTWAK